MTGYAWHVMRDFPPAHGSGKEPMYGSMSKSTKPDPNRNIEYPQVLHVLCIDSHNTSFFYEREDGTYYWLHARKNKDDVEVDVDGLQLNLFGEAILTRELLDKAIHA